MDQIDNLLSRGVDRIYPDRESFEKVLRSGKKLALYQGFDPTGTQLHIGHAVAIRKLKQFQDLGHTVIFLIGDGTGQAGDPSGKAKGRGKFLTREELRQNAAGYVAQAGKIINFSGSNPAQIRYNSDWLNSLTLVDLLDLAGNFTLQQMLERDMYQTRLKAHDPISIREFLYPLLQGYDSVAMKVDLELGGTDQTFNMLAGRTLVRSILNREKFVMTVPLLTDANGVKIGKTEGNVIGLTDPPSDFYGKIMALPDTAIIPCFELLTDTSTADLSKIALALKKGDNPMTWKKKLAYDLTEQYNSESDALKAQTEFENVHQKHRIDDLTALELKLKKSDLSRILDLLAESDIAGSKSHLKRLIKDGAVEIDNRVFLAGSDQDQRLADIRDGSIIKIGKKTFVRIKLL